jgi:hypothetical protein
MTPREFTDLVAQVTAHVAGRPLDGALEDDLGRTFPAGGECFRAIAEACREGMAAGWICHQGRAPRRFGRVVEAGPPTHGLSVDVVEIENLVGPHHRHPNGEICMIMPAAGAATFDGRGEGWLVYGPDTAHRPTVSGGRAVVLYMLPGGAIEFTGA